MGETDKIADTEYGIQVAKKLLKKIKKMEPEPLISTDDLEDVMVQGDELFYKEEKMTNEEKQQTFFFAEQEIDRLVACTLEHLGFEKKGSYSHAKSVKKNKGKRKKIEAESESESKSESESESAEQSDMETQTESEKEPMEIENEMEEEGAQKKGECSGITSSNDDLC